MKKKNSVITLLRYAGNYKILTFIGLALSAISMLFSIIPYVCIWLVVRDLIDVMPNFYEVQNVEIYGWHSALQYLVLFFILLDCYVRI